MPCAMRLTRSSNDLREQRRHSDQYPRPEGGFSPRQDDHFPGGEGHQLRHTGEQHGRAGGGIRQRQVGDGLGDPGPAPQGERDRACGQPDPVRRPQSSRARTWGIAEITGGRYFDDLSGADELAESRIHSRVPAHRGLDQAPWHDGQAGAVARSRDLARSRHSRTGNQDRRLSVPALGRPAAARDDRDEPTTALDVTIQKQILELIAALQKRLRMSVLFITHDLVLVGEIADYVVVMREGEIKEQGRVEQIFEAPRDAYTRALLLCRPQLERRPRRLPVIDDFMKPGPLVGGSLEERSRGLRGDEEIILEARHLGKSFYSREGLFGKREFKAVRDVSFKLARGKTLGIVGESGSGKTTVALTLLRLRGESSGE